MNKNNYFQSSMMAIALLFAFIFVIFVILIGGGFPIPEYLIILTVIFSQGAYWAGFLVK